MTVAADTLVSRSDDGTSLAMRLLSAHVPLTLLLDLAVPEPHSSELYRTEIGDHSWLSHLLRAPGQDGHAAIA